MKSKDPWARAAEHFLRKHRSPNGDRVDMADLTIAKATHELAAGRMSPARFEETINLLRRLLSASGRPATADDNQRLATLREQLGGSAGGPRQPPPTLFDMYRLDVTALAQRLFEALHVGKKVSAASHLPAAIAMVQSIADGARHRSVFNAPPESLKTFTFALVLPVAVLLQRPAAKIVIVTKSDEARELLMSQLGAVADLRPHEIPDDYWLSRSTDFLTTPVGGWVRVVKYGTPLEYNELDLCVLDDPQVGRDSEKLKAQTAYLLEDIARKVATNGSIVLAQSRLSPDDLSGCLLNRGGWAHDRWPVAWRRNVDGPGTDSASVTVLLCAERNSVEQLMTLMQEVGGEVFEARWLQHPQPATLLQLNVCRLVTSPKGEQKYAQEPELHTITAEERIGANTFGQPFLWVAPHQHPAPLSTAQRHINMNAREQLLSMYSHGLVTHEEFRQRDWDLM